MVLQYSPDGHMLYVQFRDDDAVETVEVEPDIYVDLDAEGRPIGIEFVNADDFFPFLGRGLEDAHAVLQVPRALEARIERLLEERGFPVEPATPAVEVDATVEEHLQAVVPA